MNEWILHSSWRFIAAFMHWFKRPIRNLYVHGLSCYLKSVSNSRIRILKLCIVYFSLRFVVSIRKRILVALAFLISVSGTEPPRSLSDIDLNSWSSFLYLDLKANAELRSCPVLVV